MNILSLFNGISGLHLACDRAGIKVDNCYYSEIDKFANMVTEHHYPNDIALGDVTKWREWDLDWSTIGLIGAGFPCQSWSVAGRQLGDKDERGMLFWTTLEIISHVLEHNPNAKFIMENVKMKKDFEEYITHHTERSLGRVYKILINSALVSAQNRNRYYWTNFEVSQPEDEGYFLYGILEDAKKYRELNTRDNNRVAGITKNKRGFRCHRGDKAKSGLSEIGRILKECADKSDTLTTSNPPKLYLRHDGIDIIYRDLSPLECERLQTLPDNWTSMLSNTQRYKSIGNGWTIDVIAHILKHI